MRDSYHREEATDRGVLRQAAFRRLYGKEPGGPDETIIHHHDKAEACKDKPHDEYTFARYPDAQKLMEVVIPVLEVHDLANEEVHVSENGLLTWNDQEHDARS